MNGVKNGVTNGDSNSNNGFEDVKIPVPWGHIAGKWWGSKSAQPVIAIHGWQDNCGSFDKLAPILVEKGLALFCIDLPGHGFSSYIPAGLHYYLWWDGIHYIRRIVRYFKWNDLVLLGHSMGGGISFMYASAFPQEIKKYICIDITSPVVRDPFQSSDMLGGAVDKHLTIESLGLEKCPCYEYKDMLEIVMDAHKGNIDKEGCEILMRRGIRPAADKKDRYVFTRDPRLKLALLGFMCFEHIRVFAGRTKCEVLNIKASKGHNFKHYDDVLDIIEKTAKKVERHVVEGTHHLHLNDPHSVADIIYNFIVS